MNINGPVIDHIIAEAIFASDVQPSQECGCAELAAIVADILARIGAQGCACRVAAEFGDHPDTAQARMRWALRVAHVIGAEVTA